MSRRQFRASVHERPASAWLLVTVASAMLWITEQLQPWVIAVQVVAITLSLARRRNPFPWQASPIWLNVGMFGIAGTTIALALDGKAATVSLAHFASLAQGLQLLDSRPRKSEFLLVTLSLFQVILASNLTDSLLFPPLLIVFVFSAVWTLMVHTLRSEAIEAGDESAANRALLSPGLRRMTIFASTAAIVLALVLFALLPRMRTSMLQTGAGRGEAMAGFSDRVELGSIGRIRTDRTVVLRVETLEGTPPPVQSAYWRGLAFDSFDGRRWAITPSGRSLRPGSVKFGIPLGRGPSHPDLVQRIVREPVAGGVLFAAGTPRNVEGALLRLESDVNGGLYDPLQHDQRIRYTIETESNGGHGGRLLVDRASLPPGDPIRYLQLPELADDVRELALRITDGLATDAERAAAIESYLRRTGHYTDTPPTIDPAQPRTPIEQFLLGDLAGHCEYFASAMVVLARSVGLPSRLVNGFAGGRLNPLGGFVELARADAHAWVEVHYAGAGWVRYDPTPPDLRLSGVESLSFAEQVAALGSTIELWWFQRVVDFDSSDQISAMKSAFSAWRRLRAPADESEHARRTFADLRIDDPGLVAAIGLSVLVVTIGAWLLQRTRRRRQGRKLPRSYERALALLARQGMVRAPHDTARGFAFQVKGATPPEAAGAFDAITEAYLAERFGAHTPDGDLFDQLERLRVALAAARRTRGAGSRQPATPALTGPPDSCGSGE